MAEQVRLEPIELSNWRQALAIRSEPDQREFVADYEPVVLVILSKCFLRPGGLNWEPFAIFAGDALVGVFALAHSPVQCVLFHLLIDRAYQGRGIGKSALDAIVQHVRRALPTCKDLYLNVHPRNTCAKYLYESAKFRNTGKLQDGEELWRLALEA